MVPKRSRRSVLQTGSVLASAVVAGCTSSSTGDSTQTTSESRHSATTTRRPETVVEESGTYATTPSGPKQYPDRPAELTENAVASYVKQFEHAIVYNSLHESDAETVSADCTSVYEMAGHGGHYALATCTGSARYSDGVYADHGQLPSFYYVSDELTVRVEDLSDRYGNCENVFASENASENVEQPCEGRTAGYRVYNLDTETHTLSVTVEFLGDETPTEMFSAEYSLGSVSGILQESVTYRRGEYRITATLGSGVQTTSRWTVGGAGYGRYETSLVVSPAGGVSIRKPPFASL
ncbi:hypothetical protein [Halorussus halophilus]|uniref:hypothetical protein n=1 Tax=Halorussus halophilus TaxID=2650975 RepID=UPI001301679A|nr:hypothetical protein [Halorussus halophilus]